MPNTKTLRGNVSIYAAYPEAFADFYAPTVAELTNADMVFDISCAVEDGYTANLTGSETDDSMSICDVSAISTPTTKNYEVSLDGFRDADRDAAGVYNKFRDLFKARGVPFVIIKRIGVAQGTTPAVDHIINMYSVVTDNPQQLLERNAPARMGARFKPQGDVNPEYKVAA